MPTYKHPCPHCGTYIERDVVACPKCGTRDPFTPGRCPNCRAPLDDPSWIACPKCGAAVGAAAVTQATQAPGPAGTPSNAHAGAIPGWGQAVTPAAATAPGPTVPFVSPPLAPVTPAPAPAPAASRTCSACGSPLAEGVRFCKDCGTPTA